MASKPRIKLNPEQRKAVKHEEGPLLVVAGAGTGKTRVIAERVRYLISKKKVEPHEILALTFTDKASEEMLARVDDIMPLGYEEPWIYTFHAFADRLLRKEGLEIGLDTSYKILPYPEQWLLLRKNLFELNLKYYLPLGNPTKFISGILKFISRLQDENVKPENLRDFVKEYKPKDDDGLSVLQLEELAGIYEKYSQIKMQNSELDFGDLILWTVKLFTDRTNVLKKYQSQFKHILVDEFQDTNVAQYDLVKRLFPPNSEDEGRSLLVVGDDSQSIYKFRGAAISNILEFQKDYPNAKMVTLLKNYRSTQQILDTAYKVVKNNNPDSLESKLGISKELVSVVDEKDETQKLTIPEIFSTETNDDQMELVVAKILEILAKEPHYTYKDFAILARANNHLDPFVLALRKYGLPYQLVGNRGLYDREEVRDVMAVLRAVINPNDSISLYRALNIDSLEIPYQEISSMLSNSRYRKIDLWEIVEDSKQEKVVDFVTLVNEFGEKISKSSPVELVYELVNSINYLELFTKEETIENNLSIKNLDLFLNKVKEFEISYRSDNIETPNLVNFLDYMDLMVEAGDNPAQAELEDIDTINLLTVHSSKGLEFPVVFLVDLVSGRFPTRNRGDPIPIPDELIKETLPEGDFHIQEERRLFYVGMTRAEKYLNMTWAKDYGGRREKKPSGFLEETGLHFEEIDLEKLKDRPSQAGLFGVTTGFREPKPEKISNLIPKFFSYTQVSSYKACPLQYKYSYVLKIPTPPNHALSFGITIHDTLRDFHAKLMFEDAKLDDLLKIYERNWQPLGYLNEEHRQHRFESGKELLKNYYGALDKDKKPVGLEKSFNVWIGGSKFFGRIDRIDPLDGGVEIIDYKTGTAKTQKDVDKDDQVSFYAIAAKEALKLKPKKLSLYYLEENQKISTTRTVEELKEQKKDIIEAVGKIKKGEFEAKPGMHCTWCDYKEICPFAWKG